MSAGPVPCLTSNEGELVSVQISVEPKSLEDLLDAVARIPFPINPEIHHLTRSAVVEFPAYANRLGEVYSALEASGLAALNIEVKSMLERIQANVI